MHSTAGRLAGKGCISGVCLSSCSSLEEGGGHHMYMGLCMMAGRSLIVREKE